MVEFEKGLKKLDYTNLSMITCSNKNIHNYSFPLAVGHQQVRIGNDASIIPNVLQYCKWLVGQSALNALPNF